MIGWPYIYRLGSAEQIRDWYEFGREQAAGHYSLARRRRLNRWLSKLTKVVYRTQVSRAPYFAGPRAVAPPALPQGRPWMCLEVVRLPLTCLSGGFPLSMLYLFAEFVSPLQYFFYQCCMCWHYLYFFDEISRSNYIQHNIWEGESNYEYAIMG
jgi:hypothetical protein